MAILLLDSGVGGLTVLREVRAALPTQQVIYVGDDAGFPYGDWPEELLVQRLVALFSHYLGHHPIDLAIVACNTASTLIMPSLRERFSIPFVGIVPAIKPAAERTVSQRISVLATPGTIARPYTQQLIADFAQGVSVNLVGSTKLAKIAEHYMQHRSVDTDALWQEIQPCFVQEDGGRTDIIALGCTHYPFLVNEMRKLAPWPVDWLDPAEAIALRARSVLSDLGQLPSQSSENDAISPGASNLAEAVLPDIAYLTSNTQNLAVRRLLQGFGLTVRKHESTHTGALST